METKDIKEIKIRRLEYKIVPGKDFLVEEVEFAEEVVFRPGDSIQIHVENNEMKKVFKVTHIGEPEELI